MYGRIEKPITNQAPIQPDEQDAADSVDRSSGGMPGASREHDRDQSAERTAEESDEKSHCGASHRPAYRSRLRSERRSSVRPAPLRCASRKRADTNDLQVDDVQSVIRCVPARRGTIARAKPSRAASRSRRARPSIGRSSPVRPISPHSTVPGAIGRSRSDDASASASGRSIAGSSTVRPPTMLA